MKLEMRKSECYANPFENVSFMNTLCSLELEEPNKNGPEFSYRMLGSMGSIFKFSFQFEFTREGNLLTRCIFYHAIGLITARNISTPQRNAIIESPILKAKVLERRIFIMRLLLN